MNILLLNEVVQCESDNKNKTFDPTKTMGFDMFTSTS